MNRTKVKGFGLGLFIVCVFIFWLSLASIIDVNYKVNAVVKGVTSNEVYAIDESGKEWIITTDNKNIMINDNITLTIDNNHTSYINDDIIIKVKKIDK